MGGSGNSGRELPWQSCLWTKDQRLDQYRGDRGEHSLGATEAPLWTLSRGAVVHLRSPLRNLASNHRRHVRRRRCAVDPCAGIFPADVRRSDELPAFDGAPGGQHARRT